MSASESERKQETRLLNRSISPARPQVSDPIHFHSSISPSSSFTLLLSRCCCSPSSPSLSASSSAEEAAATSSAFSSSEPASPAPATATSSPPFFLPFPKFGKTALAATTASFLFLVAATFTAGTGGDAEGDRELEAAVALMALLAAAAAPLAGVLGVARGAAAAAAEAGAGALRFLAALPRTGVAGAEVSPSPPPLVCGRPRVAGSRRRSFLL